MTPDEIRMLALAHRLARDPDPKAVEQLLAADSAELRHVWDAIAQARRWEALGTRISWAQWVWNMWTGCVKLGPECVHCYAESWAKRGGRKVWGRKAARPRTKTWGRVAKMRQLAGDPIWRAWAGLNPGERPRCFIGSLMDWAENRDDEQRAMVAEAWPIIREAAEVDFLLLTKRPQNIPDLLPADWGEGYPNVWLMTSCGDPDAVDGELQAPAIFRVEHLLSVPAVVHGVSYEPALAPLASRLAPYLHPSSGLPDRGSLSRHISWVIYGGESGPGHRPEGVPGDTKRWAREMRDACRAADVAFFHKQSAHRFNERGSELDGEILHEYPTPRI